MLSKFHKNIILFFCVLLIFISIIFYRNFLYLISNTSFPKYINRCPDHWDFSGNDTEHTCHASHLNQLNNFSPVIDLKQTVNAADVDAADAGDLVQLGENYLTRGTTYKSNHKLDDNFDFKNVYKKNNYCGLYEYSRKNNLQWSGITNANYTKYC
tara:strand:- start:99 stop:563 length:465 start_codon:yes stop_codon:yes gene_type:complete